MDHAKKASLLARQRQNRSSVQSSFLNMIPHLSLEGPSDITCISPVKSGPSIVCMHPVAERFRLVKDLVVVPWVLPFKAGCLYCGAYRFYRETDGFCCADGKISLAKTVHCPILRSLFTDRTTEMSREFHRRGRTYNGAFAFTSIGMRIDPQSWWARDGIFALKVVGQISHTFEPIDGTANVRSLLQLFFLDTADDLDAGLLRNRELRQDVFATLIAALSDNPYSAFFKRLRSWDSLSDAHIVIRSSPVLDQRSYNRPTVDQVAAVWKDGDEAVPGSERDIRVFTQAGEPRKIKYYYSCYDPLQYPTLFPYGEPGWHAGIPKNLSGPSTAKRNVPCPTLEFVAAPSNMNSVDELLRVEDEVLQHNKSSKVNVSCRDYYCYKAQIRENDYCYLLHAGRIGQQYFIDMYIKLETSRLDYFRSEQRQKRLRTESYQGIIDSLSAAGDIDPSSIGQRVVLPSSFIGGPRDMRRRYVNAMSLVQRFGKPDIFLTMTCNPAWKEIQDNLLPGQKPDDRPDLVARVFKAKLESLKNDLIKKRLFGQVVAYVYAIEYQKRGLPHAHWMLRFTPLSDLNNLVNRDSLIDVLALVIDKKERRTITAAGNEHVLQEYAIMNQEQVVVILTLWNNVAESEGKVINETEESFPLIRATGLAVSSHYGGSLGSTPSTVILVNPQIPEAENLKTWRHKNLKLITQAISSKDHFVHSDLLVNVPTNKTCVIADVVAETKTDKFFVRIQATVVDTDKKFFYMACEKCFSGVDADYDYAYTCAACKEYTHAKPREKLLLNINDGSGSLDVTAFGKQAMELMELSADTCMEMYKEGKSMSIKKINDNLSGRFFIMKIKKREFYMGDSMHIQYAVLNMLEHKDKEHVGSSNTTPSIESTITPQVQTADGKGKELVDLNITSSKGVHSLLPLVVQKIDSEEEIDKALSD